ncbi:MAG TPA: methyl-accepting chemotaxis protein, partial [Verrucomicrobiae bacterium]|nr:methyl-accepting chemotaxis protein [Verrucomicrobiae bacterium]
MFSNLRLRYKVTALFLVMAVAVAATGLFGTRIIGRVGGQVQNLLKAHPARERVVVLMNVALNQCRTHLLEGVLVPSGLDDLKSVRNDYEAKRDTFRGYCDLILKGDPKAGLPPAPPGSDLEQRVHLVRSSLEEFDKVAQSLLARKEELLKKLPPGGVDHGAMTDARLREVAGSELPDAMEKTTQAVDDLTITAGILTKSMNDEVESLSRSAIYTFDVVIVLAFALALGFGIFASQNIVKRIGRIGEVVDRAKEGNLATRAEADSGDELGKLAEDFNRMMVKLSAMIGKVKQATAELSSLSANICRASGNVAASARRQEGRIADTSAAMTEMGASIAEVGSAVEGLTLSASESSSSTLQLAASIEEVAGNVDTLAATVEEVSASIIEMAASIKQIDSSVASLVQAATTTASSIAEMDTSIREVEENASRTASISEAVLEDAESGKRSVDAAIAGMDEIKRASAITAEVVTTLSDKAQDIGAILSVIDEVAE